MVNKIEKRLIWLDGKLYPADEAKICVLSPTSQFGLNVFEGIPCFWNVKKKQLYAFRLKDHLTRLLNSSKLLGLIHSYDLRFLEEAFKKTIIANEYKEDLIVRQNIFVDGFGSWSSCKPCNMFISPIPKRFTSSEYNQKGLNCCVTSFRRINEDCMSPKIKCGANYINSRNGQREAIKNGFDTCIFLNSKGTVSEGPGSCLFILKGNKLITPSLTDSVLESITRDTIFVLSKVLGLECYERSIDRTELYSCDGAFLCGSSMGITRIDSIDKFAIPQSHFIEELSQLYKKVVTGEFDAFSYFLTPIY